MRLTENPFRALPALEERIAESAQSGRGVMAHVVESDGHMVTVETATSKGAIGPYPSTVAGLQPGAPGVLQPLRGNNSLFIATGMAKTAAHMTASRQSGRQSTTSISAFTTAITRLITLSEGHWELNFLVTSAYKRSVATGGAVLRLTNSEGWVNAEATMVYDSNIAGSNLSYMPISLPWKISADIPPGGRDVGFVVDFRGNATAATTWFYGTTLTGTAIKAGP